VKVTGFTRCVTIRYLFGTVIFFASGVAALGAAPEVPRADLSNARVRAAIVQSLRDQSLRRKQAAWAAARSQGWAAKWQVRDTIFELMGFAEGKPLVYKTCNLNSAISIGVDKIREPSPYELNGDALVVGIWDSGAVRSTHQEFGTRTNIKDGAANSNHSTHVGGTIGAAGIQASAEGMAPMVMVDSYEWTGDIAEMTSRAMSYPGEPDTLTISSHSYGYVCGWEHGTSPSRWYGLWGNPESDLFGLYDSEARQWDEICYNAPYYLPFKAVGNDRSDSAVAAGDTFEYYKWPKWRQKVYDPNTDPYDDDWDNGGFDTILTVSTAKNIVTVGAVHDAVSAGVRDLSRASMTSFSGWGPTDDGRIKPDIVANGVALYSPTAGSDTSYSTYSGTSMACPSAAGAAVLLVDLYDRLFAGQTMRAATLKALLIHTADDLGTAGPDYKFGWGLLNAKAAAEQIADHYRFSDANKIIEGSLTVAEHARSYAFEWDGFSAIRVTLCWTDPAGPVGNGLDSPTSRLVNDLDVRVVGPAGHNAYYPFVLNPSNPEAPATTANNAVDNLEQVLVASPADAGTYTVELTHKGVLTNGAQDYSLIISGQYADGPLAADFNLDGSIDFADLASLLGDWLESGTSTDIYPFGGDGIVDLQDFARLARHWMEPAL